MGTSTVSVQLARVPPNDSFDVYRYCALLRRHDFLVDGSPLEHRYGDDVGELVDWARGRGATRCFVDGRLLEPTERFDLLEVVQAHLFDTVDA